MRAVVLLVDVVSAALEIAVVALVALVLGTIGKLVADINQMAQDDADHAAQHRDR